MIKSFEKAKDKVKYILEEYPDTRDCDITLYCYYLLIYHNLEEKLGTNNCTKLINVMRDAPVPETVRRVRQKIQEGGDCLGRKRQERLRRAADVRENIHNL